MWLLQLPSIPKFSTPFLHGGGILRSAPTATTFPAPSAPCSMPTIRAMKSMQGKVVCATSDKTLAVEVVRLAPHPKYKRRVRKKKKYQAHDPDNQFKVGDIVQLLKSRPISKTKTFVAVSVPKKDSTNNPVDDSASDIGIPLESFINLQNFALKACSALFAIGEGRGIHECVIRTGWERNFFVGATVIDMYAKCGCLIEARHVFNKIVVRDAVLWNSILAAYAWNGHLDESLALCRYMVVTGVRPTEATLVIVISSSADIACLPHGKEIHGFAWRHGFHSNDKVKTALIDMYAKWVL
ncbi:30S ribosomal protein [Arachis hypogaea]|uniref:Small ribosomal subunit protein uS17c n=1 Tax=Arachis hypogaea TaxID=3818 RepID=A0A444YIH7_ARAHY|nr:30S ribosomal protein [Arachis hypogaea]RYR01711.1 hypothetical protein Ahy_B06g080577 [Arachis hypogaea]